MKESNTVILANEIGNARRIYKSGLQVVRNSMLEISAVKHVDVAPLYLLVDEIMNSLERNKDALLCVSRIKPQDAYTIAHSLSVCILIAAFTKQMKIDKDEAKQIALGALLGDVGKLRVSQDLLNKPGKLTELEFKQVKKHAKYTYALLCASKRFSEITIRAATEHHERLDGSGYPFGLEESQISIGGRMTAIADVYDALSSPRIYQNAKTSKEIFKLMYDQKADQFKKSMMQRFIRMVGMYPIGSMVALSDAKLAVVIEHGINNFMLPRVKTVFDLRKKSLIQNSVTVELEDLNPKNGLSIIRPVANDEIKFNPISAIA